MKNLFSLDEKVALITGGSKGIGSALIKGFVDAGARVGSFSRTLSSDKSHKCWKVDLLEPSNITSGFNSFIQYFGRVDILVNCAAITRPSSNLDYPLVLWEETMRVNLDAVFCLCKLAGIKMIEQGNGGSIINFTSICAQQVSSNNPAYAVAKGGVRQLTKALALDWGVHNIRVNNLGPGYVRTSMNEKSLADEEAYQLRADNSMLGRWAEPEEMVGPAIFLASDASSYVTGTDLWVDGGWLSKGI